MPSVTFTGSALRLESVTQISLATVRVKFTQLPLAVSPTGTHDALNTANWSLVGPGVVIIASCNAVAGDLSSIDLFLTGPLSPGVWTVTASNIQTAAGANLNAPTSLTFTVSLTGKIEPVNVGSINDTDEDIIRKHLNPALAGTGWDALIAAIATGEKTNRQNAQYAFDQMFTSTSSGLYLERHAADTGIERPENMGLSDETFRQYVIRLTNDKLTEEAILEILQVFYGDSSLRASSATGIIGPYILQNGDDLQIVLDGVLTVNVIFNQADFSAIGQASAAEVASVITRAFRQVGSKAYATATTDPQTGLSTVTIFSGSLGLSSSVQVIGGKAQNALQFATLLPVYKDTTSPTWNITINVAAGTARFTSTSTDIDLSKLQPGDYVNIYGNEFNTANKGSFTVTSVSVTYPGGSLNQYFEIVNTKAVQQLGLVQLAQSDLLYFRPTVKTIHSTLDRTAIVTSQLDGIDITLPATSQAVSRQELTAAYAQANTAVNISSLLRASGLVTAAATAHNLTAGSWIFVDGATPSLTPPTVTAGNGTTTTSYAATTVVSTLTNTSARQWISVAALADGRAIVVGGQQPTLNGGSTVVGLYTVTGSTPHTPNGTQYTFTVVTDSPYPVSLGMTAATLLLDPAGGNKVLVCGGTATFVGALAASSSSAYLYTPGNIGSTGTWAATGSMNSGRAGHVLVQRSDYLVMAIGGYGAASAVATTETYNAATKIWTNTASMSTARVHASAAQLKTTDILVTGGRTGGFTQLDFTSPSNLGTITNLCELYNISGNTWTTVGAMTYARTGHQIFVLDDGRAIVIGGIGYDPSYGATAAYLNTTEIYDPVLKIWTRGPAMTWPRAFFYAQRIGSKIYVFGGNTGNGSVVVEYLDLNTLTWKNTVNKAAIASIKAGCCLLNNGLMLVSTGANATNFSATTNAQVLTAGSDTFATGDLNGLRQVYSVIDANTFTYKTNTQSYTAAGACTATPVAAATSSILGPHSYDLDAGVAVTNIETSITQNLNAGQNYGSVTVSDATQFPDEPGWLVFAFGYNNQVQPVKYLGRVSSTALALDYNFKFPQTVLSGSKVTMLEQRGPWIPAAPQMAGSFYLTDSSAGRIAAQSAINAVTAAGVNVDTTITYPGDRGLGNEGYPDSGNYKVSDVVEVWGSDNVDADLQKARGD